MVSFGLSGSKYEQLIRDAYKKSEITISKAAELLGLSAIEMRERVNDWQWK